MPHVSAPNLIADMLLPPVSLAVLALLLVLAGRRWRGLAAAALAVLVVLGLPVVANGLQAGLAPAPSAEGAAPGAIVILSADGIRTDTGQLDPGLLTIDRMRAGAALARRTGLPLLVSGGMVDPGTEPLATMMARSLQDDFGVTPRWVEDRSLDTWQNAAFSAAALREAGVRRIYLVTHGWHMRRAELAFARAGLEVVPAPVRPPRRTMRIADFIPRAAAWEASYLALHEWVGLAFYALRR